jgi:hypothetical protein
LTTASINPDDLRAHLSMSRWTRLTRQRLRFSLESQPPCSTRRSRSMRAQACFWAERVAGIRWTA